MPPTSYNQPRLLGDESVRGTERRCGDLWSRCSHNFCLFDVHMIVATVVKMLAQFCLFDVDKCGQDVLTIDYD